MIRKKIFTTLFLAVSFQLLFSQNKIDVTSPDRELNFRFGVLKGRPEYSVSYKNKILVEHSTLGLTFADNDFFGNDIETRHITVTDGIDDYTLPEGKTSKVHDTYKEAAIPCVSSNGKKRLIYLRVRVFDDGVAFRYELPEQNDWQQLYAY